MKLEKKHPWYATYYRIYNRCTNKNSLDYQRYGGRGIKLLMSLDDFKYLWYRDKAYLLKKPSIDRIDNDGNYELSNCRYIEVSINSRKDKIGKPCFNTNRKLSDKQVIRIRKLYNTKKYKLREIASKFNIHNSQVWRLCNNQRRTYLK